LGEFPVNIIKETVDLLTVKRETKGEKRLRKIENHQEAWLILLLCKKRVSPTWMPGLFI